MSDELLKHNAKCAARHLGLWMAERTWLHATWNDVKNGVIKADVSRETRTEEPLYEVYEGNLAVIRIVGPMMKGESKYTDTCNTVNVRRAFRKALSDKDVGGILLYIESPGGTFSGTDELGQDISFASRKKPVYAHIDDLGASAAYWAASQANSIFANQAASIGSIGVVAILEDTSGQYDFQRIKVHVIQSGPDKAPFVDGVPVSEEAIAKFQDEVDHAAGFFFDAVKRGRGMSATQLKEVNSGAVFNAAKAQELGLIDGVQGLDATIDMLRKEIKARQKTSEYERKVREQRIK